jgi:hypothetical protein
MIHIYHGIRSGGYLRYSEIRSGNCCIQINCGLFTNIVVMMVIPSQDPIIEISKMQCYQLHAM